MWQRSQCAVRHQKVPRVSTRGSTRAPRLQGLPNIVRRNVSAYIIVLFMRVLWVLTHKADDVLLIINDFVWQNHLEIIRERQRLRSLILNGNSTNVEKSPQHFVRFNLVHNKARSNCFLSYSIVLCVAWNNINRCSLLPEGKHHPETAEEMGRLGPKDLPHALLPQGLQRLWWDKQGTRRLQKQQLTP